MSEKFRPEEFFSKNRENSDMLKQAMESERIDAEILQILNEFFLLPLTPRESCYGHPEKDANPYLSYVEDDVQNKQEENFQRLFKEKISELSKRINEKIGSESVDVSLEEENHGGGPIDYTLYFKIPNKENYKKNGEKILKIIWSEFSNYINELK